MDHSPINQLTLRLAGSSSGVTPKAFALEQNYPNPFNPSTEVKYELPVPSHVVLKVYNVLGNEVAIIVDEKKSAGSYVVTWNADEMPSGVYLYRLTAGDLTITRKMLLLR